MIILKGLSPEDNRKLNTKFNEIENKIDSNSLSSRMANALDSDKHYEHNQIIASATWHIVHNLRKFPSVTIVDSAGTEVIGTVKYTNENSLTITFSSEFSGKAYLN